MEPIRRNIDTRFTQYSFNISEKIRGLYLLKFLKLIILRRDGKLGNVRGDDYIHTAVIHFKDIDKRVS